MSSSPNSSPASSAAGSPARGAAEAVLTRNVAPGIHRLSHAFVNCYLVEEAGKVTIVDAAFPSTWPHLLAALTGIRCYLSDVKALVLTHAHFDHLGFAMKLADEWGIPTWVHQADHYIAAHPYRYAHERNRTLYPVLYPRAIPVLGAMTAAGALNVPSLPEPGALPVRTTLDVPGHPFVVPCPGHTYGHCALHFPDRDAIITGDAIVTFDPYTAVRGAQIVAGAATADSRVALSSIDALAETDATIVLPGHGAPWRSGIGAAVAAAQAAGAS